MHWFAEPVPRSLEVTLCTLRTSLARAANHAAVSGLAPGDRERLAAALLLHAEHRRADRDRNICSFVAREAFELAAMIARLPMAKLMTSRHWSRPSKLKKEIARLTPAERAVFDAEVATRKQQHARDRQAAAERRDAAMREATQERERFRCPMTDCTGSYREHSKRSVWGELDCEVIRLWAACNSCRWHAFHSQILERDEESREAKQGDPLGE